jgi:hypothetical protein
MTSTTVPTPAVTPGLANRVAAVVRLHFVNVVPIIVMPWIILLTILAMNIAIWALILWATDPSARADVRAGLGYSGATLFIFNYMCVVAVQAISGTFPFALGFSVTRRDYAIGTGVAFVIIAAVFGAGMTLLAILEDATGGWGLGGHMFTTVYFGDGPWFERFFTYTAGLLFFLFIGSLFAAVWVRWKAFGLVLSFALLALLLIGLGALAGLTDSWAAIGDWFASTGTTGLYAWSLLLALLAAVGGFALLRRATPKG